MHSKFFVDANYRFVAAYQEVNTRINQRQHALTLYVTLVVSLLAALVALKPGGAGGTVPVEWLALGFPVVSLCLAFLNYKAERSITNLREFLSALEQLDDAHLTLPSYNTDPKWAIEANKARRFHDLAAAVLVAGSNAIGIGAVVKIYPQRIAENPLLLWSSIAIAAVSLLVLALNPKWSYAPDDVKN